MQKKISSTPVYEGTIFHMSRDEVEIKGKTYPRDVIHHDGGVGVLAIRMVKFTGQTVPLCNSEGNAGDSRRKAGKGRGSVSVRLTGAGGGKRLYE